MKISEFIERLEDLKHIAGDVEVTVRAIPNRNHYLLAAAELQRVCRDWVDRDEKNDRMVVAVF